MRATCSPPRNAAQTEPLSTVYVYFSANHTHTVPSRVIFDYANYDEVQTVTVSGVDDSIDQGAWYLDHIRVNFTSTDVCAAPAIMYCTPSKNGWAVACGWSDG